MAKEGGDRVRDGKLPVGDWSGSRLGKRVGMVVGDRQGADVSEVGTMFDLGWFTQQLHYLRLRVGTLK